MAYDDSLIVDHIKQTHATDLRVIETARLTRKVERKTRE